MALEVDIMPNMKITVTKLTTPDLARLACQYTMHSHAASAIALDRLYAM